MRDQLRVAVALVAMATGFAAALRAAGDPRDAPAWSVRRVEVERVRVDGPTPWEAIRVAGGWRLATPIGAADPDALHELLDAAEEASDAVPVDGIDAASAGLDAPVRLTLWTGDGTRTLDVGADAPVGGRTYVRLQGGPILAVRGGLGQAVRRSVPVLEHSHER